MNRRWQRKRERARHADDWLMTYADMITLLLCFFAIFLSVAIPKKDAPHKVEVPQLVEQPQPQQPVKPLDIVEGNLPFHGLTAADMPTEDIPDQAPPKPIDPPSPPLPVKEPPKVPQEIASNASVDPTPAPVAQEKAAEPSTTLLEIVNRLKAQGTANIDQKGDRITTIQVSSAAFFASGSATLSSSGELILRDVAFNLKSERFKDYQITVEGHTDDSPIKTLQFPSNWELSTARASAVVHFFLDQGVPARKLRAAGYADTFPLVPNRDAKGNPIPENQAQNRRVIIKLEKIEKTGNGTDSP